MLRNSQDAEPEEVELYEDLSSDLHGDEQRQHLLRGEKELGTHDSLKASPRKRSRRTWLVALGALLCGIAILGMIMSWLKSEVTEAQHEVAEALGVQCNDYILDPSWDVEAPSQTREYTWTIRDQLHNPDGVFRPMILVNNQFPGPLIEANDGDTIVVHIDNRAVNATSIHWHGLYQNGTPHMDGTIGVTQCPIAPGARFTYEFTISGQHGTTWWHGHQGVQASDGLHGPIVIHSRKEKELQLLPYDTDRVILLSDHYHDLSSALMFQYLLPDAENTEPVPESALINGRGIRDCDTFPHRKCDNTTSHVGLPVVQLEHGKSHRLRLVNVGAFAEFQFQIDEHELAVTEVDGTDVAPVSYHRININTAQRYSVIVNANVTSAAAFWMRARMITKCFTDPPKTINADALAMVQYNAIDLVPASRDWEETLALECRDMNTTDLIPTSIVAAPSEPDAVFYLRSNFEIGNYRLSRGFFNASSWRPNPHSPALLRTVDGLAARNTSFDTVTTSSDVAKPFVNTAAFDIDRELVIQTQGIQTIDILISNFDDGNHPLHLHGYKYFVMAQGHGAPPLTQLDAAIDRDSLSPLYAQLDTSNPLRRDTASVEAFGWILLRVVADNPGMWAFHCHVAWHAEAGLLMQFLTRSDELAKLEIPQASLDLCSANGLEKGMALDDSEYADFAK